MSAMKSGIRYNGGELSEAAFVFLVKQLAERVQEHGKFVVIEVKGRALELALRPAKEHSNG